MLRISIYLVAFLVCLQGKSQGNYDHSSKYPISNNGTIFLSSEDANVSIKAEDRMDVHVEIHREIKGTGGKEEFSFNYRAEQGNLYIEERSSNSGFLNWNSSVHITRYTIDIKAPYDVNLNISGEDDDYVISSIRGNIMISSEDGDVSLNGCSGEQISLRLEDGDISAQGLQGSLNIENEDGDIVIGNSRLAKLTIQSEDGDIGFSSGSVQDAELRLSDGDVILPEVFGKLTLRNEDGDINISTLSAIQSIISSEDGDIVVGLDAQDNGSYDFRSHDGDIVIISSGGGAEFDIKTDDGDVAISKGHFQYVKDDEHHKIARSISQGSARVSVQTQDGDISLKRNE